MKNKISLDTYMLMQSIILGTSFGSDVIDKANSAKQDVDKILKANGVEVDRGEPNETNN